MCTPPVWLSSLLCIFARLPPYSCMSLCVVYTLIQWNYGHSILGHPLLFNNMFICLFVCFTCLFAPIWHLLIACLLACFLSTYFFTCLLAYFFCHCMYMLEHGHLEQECDLLGTSKWARMQARRCKPTKSNV